MAHTAQVFQDGQNQLVRLPQGFQLRGRQVYLKKVGNVILLIPEDDPWQILFDSLHLFSDDFMEDRAQPRNQEREEMFG